jgi:5-methylcytosine-specific restriction endonuclease McrA
MRVLRRFPALEGALRDGRLCLSTVTLLGPLLTPENLADLVARASYLTKAEVEHLVVSLQPRTAPRDGIRKLGRPAQDRLAEHELPQRELVVQEKKLTQEVESARPEQPVPQSAEPLPQPLQKLGNPHGGASAPTPQAAIPPSHERRRPELRPVSAEEWSLRVTLDAPMKSELDQLTSLLSHSTRGDLTAVLREAIRCGIEKHGKRKGAVAPARRRAASPRKADELADTAARTSAIRPPANDPASVTAPANEPSSTAAREAEPAPHGKRTAIPAEVRREVWKRDGGCCAWIGKDGRRCGSRWMLEFDHVRPVALGGKSTIENIRVACRPHNFRYAEHIFGREHMSRFLAPGV